MKRHPALRDLSSEHHHALVLVRAIRNAKPGDEQALRQRVLRTFQHELEPHFEAEERQLLPRLQEKGEAALVKRTLAEHAELQRQRGCLEQAGGLERFAELLEQHVRFEERVLFEACQRCFTDAEMEEVFAAVEAARPPDT